MRIAIFLVAALVFVAAWLFDTKAVLQLAGMGLFGSRYGWLIIGVVAAAIALFAIRNRHRRKKSSRRPTAKRARKPARAATPSAPAAKRRTGAPRRPAKAARDKRKG